MQELGQTLDVEPLIWALVIGADFGGNATIVGASANVVGVPATILTMLVGTVDIWLRYIAFK